MRLFKLPYIITSLLFCCCPVFGACSGRMPGKSGAEVLQEKQLPHIKVSGADGQLYEFKVELARSPHEHAVGLMHRQSLPADQGMLFIFNDDAVRSFWMKNTLIPLDMLFISNAGQVVGIVHEAEPLTLDSRSVGQKSRYVLEINGGLARKLRLTEGSMVDFGEIAKE